MKASAELASFAVMVLTPSGMGDMKPPMKASSPMAETRCHVVVGAAWMRRAVQRMTGPRRWASPRESSCVNHDPARSKTAMSATIMTHTMMKRCCCGTDLMICGAPNSVTRNTMTRQTPARGPLVRRETPSGEIRTWRSPRQAEIWPTVTTPTRTTARYRSGSTISPAVIRVPMTLSPPQAGSVIR